MATRATQGSASALPAIPTAADRLSGHRQLLALINRVCDEERSSICDDLSRVTDWEPLFADLSEMQRAMAAARGDANEWLATVVMLSALTPEKMRYYVRAHDFASHIELLEGLDSYGERLRAVEECVQTAFARLFAATYEAHGTPARPALAAVEG